MEERPVYGTDVPMGSLAVKQILAPGEEKDIRFFISWDFPNRLAWRDTKFNVGNYYASKYTDSWDVAKQTIAWLPELEKGTLTFVNAFFSE